MTEMTAFERRVAEGMLYRAGPIRTVDDLAIYEAVSAASRSHGWALAMVSALKFVVAGIIVALFGGLLLAGILTTPQDGEVAPAAVTESPSPSTTEGLLPGVALDLTEVEAGVFRVVDDGIRDLAKRNNDDIVSGPDGSIWLLRSERFFRLGSDGWHEWPPSRSWDRDFEVAPDGTVWMHAGSAIQSFDGQGWTTRQSTDGVAGLEIAPDGTVWATWLSRSGVEVFGLLDEDGGRILDSPAGGLVPSDRGILSLLPVTDPDDIWATFNDGIGTPEVVRAVDGVWRRLVDVEGTEATWRRLDEQALGDSPEVGSLVADVGLDGTVWGVATFLDAAADSMENDLYRFDGSQWRRWSLQDIGFEPGQGHAQFKVAPDASVWFGVRAGLFGGPDASCDGVARFDGQTWDRHLEGLCVRAIDITADGVVWLLAREPDKELRHVYVIDPETAAATRAEVDDPPEVEVANDTTETRPMTTEELLSGMVTEEVEPGVFRVINDGMRDLSKANNTDIVAGHDGGVWLLRPQRFFRLGDDEERTWAAAKKATVSDFEVAPDGTIWTIQTPNKEGVSTIESFDGEGWTTYHKVWDTRVLEVTPDGTAWAIWGDSMHEEDFGYLDEDGWQVLGELPRAKELLVAGPDDVWAIGWEANIFSRYLYRFVDGAWQRWVTMEGTEPTWQPAEERLAKDAEWFDGAGVGPDGTFWGVTGYSSQSPPGLVRFDGSDWRRWPIEDAFWLASPFGATPLGVAPDGSVWYALSQDECGVGHFDGEAWDRYLSGLCVEALDISADGSVWLLADSDVYVITPEAVVAAKP